MTKPTYHLVGYMELLAAGQLFWCRAFADPERDAELITFDAATIDSLDRIILSENFGTVAVVSGIEKAQVDDPEDYLVAWSIWLEARPLYYDRILVAQRGLPATLFKMFDGTCKSPNRWKTAAQTSSTGRHRTLTWAPTHS
jgi:hypothetical protein